MFRGFDEAILFFLISDADNGGQRRRPVNDFRYCSSTLDHIKKTASERIRKTLVR